MRTGKLVSAYPPEIKKALSYAMARQVNCLLRRAMGLKRPGNASIRYVPVKMQRSIANQTASNSFDARMGTAHRRKRPAVKIEAKVKRVVFTESTPIKILFKEFNANYGAAHLTYISTNT